MSRQALLPGIHWPGPVGRVPLWLFTLTVVAFYLGSAALAIHFIGAGPVATIWPAAAVALAAFLLAGWWMLPVILVADIASAWLNGLPVLPLAVAGNTLGPLLGAIVFRRIVSLSPLPQSLRETARLLFLILPLIAVITTLSGVLAVQLAGRLNDIDSAILMGSWWLGDMLGLVAFAPLFMALGTRICGFTGVLSGRSGAGREETLLVVSGMLVLASVTWLLPDRPALLPALGNDGLQVIPLMLLLFVMTLWSALRLPSLLTYCLLPLAILIALDHGTSNLQTMNDMAITLQWLLLLPALLIMAAATHLIEAGDRERDFFEQRLRYQSAHDPLTGLLNRRAFERRAREGLASARSERETLLAYLDLDQFQTVNDTLGHGVGDEMLAELAKHMGDVLTEEDCLARLGGDEFGLIIDGQWEEDGGERLQTLHRHIEAFRFLRSGRSFSVRASIGVTTLSGDPEDYGRLLGTADVACMKAKEEGRNRILFSTGPDEVHQRLDEMEWLPIIQNALDEGRIQLHSQALVNLNGDYQQKPTIEILCRLFDTAGELLSPARFIPAAERFGLMPELDRQVVQRALEWLASTERPPGRCFINLSATSISQAEFVEELVDAIRDSGVPGQRLGFEITETATIRNYASAHRLIRQLQGLGCVVALDDFGAGMSSFGHLEELAVDFVKIDGRFVRSMSERPMNEAIVRSISEIGRSSGIRTVAECVENAETVAMLRRIGIDYAQGFHFGRPAPLEEVPPREATPAEAPMKPAPSS
ncbi:putative bifunctional diguanylate cyclase/phosphodiesterase [Natronospira bacteriovora]|uniref:EAL domain-containing protein n=1 Tax=Natronospira bacteriovora TaxID=3069753 RepID=A0ABU0WA14_9GAMM|nr:EAL domain-containing protein [Natronospira sp. AB-CW4]MDQ2070876.1 EAL domain-containing protein [Natronospira sp. AB-CW4]